MRLLLKQPNLLSAEIEDENQCLVQEIVTSLEKKNINQSNCLGQFYCLNNKHASQAGHRGQSYPQPHFLGNGRDEVKKRGICLNMSQKLLEQACKVLRLTPKYHLGTKGIEPVVSGRVWTPSTRHNTTYDLLSKKRHLQFV